MNSKRLFLWLSLLAVISLGLPAALYGQPGHNRPAPSFQPESLELQATIEKELAQTITQTDAKRGCIIVMDMHSGQLIALANASGSADGTNMAFGSAWEPGSVMKPLLTAAAIDAKAIDPTASTFTYRNYTLVDGFRISNAIEYKEKTASIQDIITHSINTGVVDILRSLGDGNAINETSRQRYHTYLRDQYRFGHPTGIAPELEAKGYLATPQTGDKLEIQYANMAFGQGMTVTPIQLISAYNAVLNGGVYYQPHLKPGFSRVVDDQVVSPETSRAMRQLLETAFKTNTPKLMRPGITMGGKTGTAHSSDVFGQYKIGHRDNGTYVGYVSQANREYIMLVRIDEPRTDGFASGIARDTWGNIVTSQLDSHGYFIKK